jgi:predicted nucleotidyltransferase
MDIGLPSNAIEKILAEFRKFPQIEKAILYGSRAMGTSKPGSDIDLSLVGQALNQEIVWKVSQALDDTLLPFVFDLSLFETLDNPDLKAHIARVGIVFYQAA